MYIKQSYASEYLTPLTAWPNWCNMVCLLLLLLCFLVSAAGPPPLWFASSRRSAVPFPSLSVPLARAGFVSTYVQYCAICKYNGNSIGQYLEYSIAHYVYYSKIRGAGPPAQGARTPGRRDKPSQDPGARTCLLYTSPSPRDS